MGGSRPRAQLEEVIADGTTVVETYLAWAHLHQLEGRPAEARALAQRFVAWARARPRAERAGLPWHQPERIDELLAGRGWWPGQR